MKQNIGIAGILALVFSTSVFADSIPLPEANSGIVTVLAGQSAVLNIVNYDEPAFSCSFTVSFIDPDGHVMDTPASTTLQGGASATTYVNGANHGIHINIDFSPQLAANAGKLDPMDGCYRLIPTFEVVDPTNGTKVVDPIFVGMPSPKVGDKVTKVEVCHKPGTPAEKTMMLPLVSLRGHLNHGDTLGACH